MVIITLSHRQYLPFVMNRIHLLIMGKQFLAPSKCFNAEWDIHALSAPASRIFLSAPLDYFLSISFKTKNFLTLLDFQED